jgi:polyferredoxin
MIYIIFHVLYVFNSNGKREWRDCDEIESLVQEAVEAKTGPNNKIQDSGLISVVYPICGSAVLRILSPL